jgi:transcription antitermination factor NusG
MPASLFAGYVFVRIEDRWRVIDWTLADLNLVKFGESPAKCPDAEVARLQAQTDQNGFVHLADPPAAPRRKIIPAGTRVKIVAGPLAGLAAIHTGMSQHDRELVLMNVLGRETPVGIASGLVVPAS